MNCRELNSWPNMLSGGWVLVSCHLWVLGQECTLDCFSCSHTCSKYALLSIDACSAQSQQQHKIDDRTERSHACKEAMFFKTVTRKIPFKLSEATAKSECELRITLPSCDHVCHGACFRAGY